MKLLKQFFAFIFIETLAWLPYGVSRNIFAAVTTDNIKYGTSTSLSCPSISTLASSQTAAASCISVDNTSTLAIDYYVTVISTTGAGSPANDKAIYVYVYGSEDGTNYELEESSSPSSGGPYTINNPNGFKIIAVIPVATASKQYTKTFSIASAFSGVCPRKWGLIIENFSGQTLAGFAVTYTAITYTNQ